MGNDREFDVVVIGAGPVGENVADRAAQGGLEVAVVESELVGGECSYWACMPSKALLRPGQALSEACAVRGADRAVTGELDAGEVLARRDGFTHGWDDSSQVEWLDGAGITLVRGHGRLAGARRVETPLGIIEARHAVVIATGSSAAIPPIPGLAEARPWTNREGTGAKAVPARLAVLGGGVVGCELAQAWASLGSSVVVIEAAPGLLATHEPFVGELVAEAMDRQGIEIYTGRKATAVERDAAGTGEQGAAGDEGAAGAVIVTLEDGTKVTADEILVAVGRRPRTEDIGLETVGLEPGAWLDVDDSLLVAGVEGGWLYATGDVNHRALLTHQGKYQGRVCGDVIAARAKGDVTPRSWDRFSATADHGAVPSVVFTDPAVASVGLTEAKARSVGLAVRVVDYDMASVAGASLFADGYTGRARMIVDEARRVIVGVTFVGPGVAELLHSATVAIVGEVSLDRLWHAVPSYPTISEVWLRLLESYGL